MQKIGVIGLGYVGLPLARLFATQYAVVGFDIKQDRVRELREAQDHTGELTHEQLQKVLKEKNDTSEGLYCTSDTQALSDVTTFIITVPTPIDHNNNPDLTPLEKASITVGRHMQHHAVVIYESTVYPGVTEEFCVPILERESGFTFNTDFFIGYSPERINPGDKKHTIEKIKKVVSGSTPTVAQEINTLYASVIEAGTYLAPNIKVAEAAKVIENSQRDINIAFVNELAKIFNLMDIDTGEVLKAAGTKWNFLPFKPGLVGGHCIGVDPYYLAQKAKQLGYHPEIILAGRRLNDSMGPYVASQVVKLMAQADIKIKGSHILILGITFKENCPDVRNTRVVDVYTDLKEYGAQVSIYDPVADKQLVKSEYGIDLVSELHAQSYDAVVLGVGHTQFNTINLEHIKKDTAIVYDVKGFLKTKVDGRL